MLISRNRGSCTPILRTGFRRGVPALGGRAISSSKSCIYVAVCPTPFCPSWLALVSIEVGKYISPLGFSL